MRKKKFLSSLLTFAMMLCLMPMKMSIADPTTDTTLSIVADKTEVHPGDTINYTVKMGPIEGLNVFQITLDIPEGLTFVSPDEDELTMSVANKLVTKMSNVSYDNDTKTLAVLNCGAKTDANAKYSSTTDTTIMTFSCTVDEGVTGDKTVGFIENVGSNVMTKLSRSYAAGDTFGLTFNGATVTIEAAPNPATGISLDKPEVSGLELGSEVNLIARLDPDDSTSDVTWESSTPSIATVTPATTTQGNHLVTVKGLSEGTATITATANGHTATCAVQVVAVPACEHPVVRPVTGYESKVEATCTEDGHYEVAYCGQCEKYVVYKTPEKVCDTEEEAKAAAVIPAGHVESEEWYHFDDDNHHWRKCTRCNDKIDSTKEAHSFGTESYEWSADNSTCTAKHTCSKCGREVSETANATSEEIAATCTEAAKTKYTATFTKTGFETQTKEVAHGEPAGHNWGTASYEWSADNKTCTAKHTCTKCSDEETENGTVTSSTTATCTAAGETTYTATFTKPGFATQTKTVAVDPLGHDYITTIVNEVTDTEDGLMTKECSRCGDKEEVVVPALGKGQAKQLVASVPMNGENIGLVIQDPYEVLPDGTKLVVDLAEKDSARWNELSPQLDGKYPIENVAFFDIKLTDLHDNQLPMPLSQKVRVLIQIPTGWDKEDLEAVLVSSGADIDFEESIVTKDGVDYLAFWTDHFSPYAAIDKLTDAEAAELAAISAAEKAEKGKGGLKTGETIEMYVTFSMILFSAAGILLISLKKRRKAE